MSNWVNGDLIRMARELDEQEREISDDQPNAMARQVRLTKASAYLRLAFAELLHLQNLPGPCKATRQLSSGRTILCQFPAGHDGLHEGDLVRWSP